MDILPIDQPRIMGEENEYGVQPDADMTISYEAFSQAVPADLLKTCDFDRGGRRIYADQQKNIEICTPECLTAAGLLAAHFAGEQIAAKIGQTLFQGEKTVVNRTADAKLKTRGVHENYLTGRGFRPNQQGYDLLLHLATRGILIDPGIYVEREEGNWEYELSPKIQGSIGGTPIHGSSTSEGEKPFILTRDENFDSNGQTQRLQVVSANMNMFAYPLAARFFNTSSVLRLIEHGKYPSQLRISSHTALPIAKATSSWPHHKQTFEVGFDYNPVHYTAPQVQQELAALVLALCDLPDDEKRLAQLSGEIAADIEAGHESRWDEHLEWVAKHKLVEAYAAKHSLPETSARLSQIDIQWHDLPKTPDTPTIITKLRQRKRVAMMPSDEAIQAAYYDPPDQTRAQRRSRAIRHSQKSGRLIKSMNWHTWTYADSAQISANNAYQSSF